MPASCLVSAAYITNTMVIITIIVIKPTVMTTKLKSENYRYVYFQLLFFNQLTYLYAAAANSLHVICL